LNKYAYPETLHHLISVNTELLGISDSELTDGESPSVKTGTEGDGSLVGVDLEVTESLVEVGGDDDVDRLDGSGEGLVQVLLGDLKFEKSTIDLVDDNNRLDALTKGLSQDGLGLDTDTFNGVDDDKSTISDTQGSSNLGGEIDVTGRVDQVDQESVAADLLSNDVLEIVLGGKFTVQGDGSRLDGDTALLLVGSGIRGASISGLCCRDNSGLGEKTVGEGGLWESVFMPKELMGVFYAPFRGQRGR
jgi:hypothetical protein